MSIDKFKSIFKKGVQSTNRYMILLDNIKGLPVPEVVLYSVFAVTTENVESLVLKSSLYGVPTKSVGSIRHDGALQLTVMLDAEGKVKDFFDQWQNLQRDIVTNAVKYKENYHCPKLSIIGLSKKSGKPMAVSDYISVFPSKVSGIIYSNDNGTIIPQITVTIEYDSTSSYNPNDKSSKAFRNVNSEMNSDNTFYDMNNQPIIFNNNEKVDLYDALQSAVNESKWGINGKRVDKITNENDILTVTKETNNEE